MNDTNKSYRIKANVGADSFISVSLEQDYEALDILSLKIKSDDVYRLHNSNYGVIVGRVVANGGFGVPNAKISIFIERDPSDGGELSALYPFSSPASKDKNGVRYNLLPDEKTSNCHQVVGTFPNKRYLLDNEDIIEMFDKYFKYTTRTNNSGDYMICGVPTGNHTLHMDLDLSDCGILSQRPRDFVYKGYTIEQFENPNMFKKGKDYSNLSQIFTQDQSVYVRPFWGNDSLGETIGITRADIEVAFKFEPTCVFMGSIVSDNSSQGISKKCIPTPHMGDMDELTTGEGTIEMIRKTYAGDVEEFQVKGTELIDGNGIWCYQIPMNLDYMMTDEYGNMVPTDNPEKGIPTRTRVRFRVSMQDMEKNVSNYFRPKVLVPHNPQNLQGISHEDYDYEFGTFTKDESFRDLLWNGVYTVKSYIPRFQKRKVAGWKEDKFTGIKHCQEYGRNNPMPYNNMRIRLPFMFTVMCLLIKIFIKVVSVVNTIISGIGNALANFGDVDLLGWLRKGIDLISKVNIFAKLKKWLFEKVLGISTEKISWQPFKALYKWATTLKLNVIDEGLCPDLENWYFAPMSRNNLWVPTKKVPKGMDRYDILKQTLNSITVDDDPYSIDDQNQDNEDEATCLTISTDYLISCIEMNLAQEYKVINFDFYNDWINGTIYIPRFMRYIRKKRKFLGITIAKAKVKGCMDDKKIFAKSRRYTQMCSIGYKKQTGTAAYNVFSKAQANLKNKIQIVKSNNLHKKRGLTQQKIFGKNGGICHENETMYGQYVYYLKPCEWETKGGAANRKVNLYATDIVLLGSLSECDLNGIPQAFKHLASSSYIMPTNLALTNMEENGPLYAYGNKGVICSKMNQTRPTDKAEDLYSTLSIVEGENPLESELRYYSGASSNYDTMYDDPSDTIAITEAAGISWNYSGPGQGKIDKRRLYYPGGHFLGLSCSKSQTNIKSCVNLERICELGATMSQRREEVRSVGELNGEAVLEYTYNIPTGLISGDDIIDDEFRVMFATMNMNRLIASKTNPNTGYKVYDFSYVNPVNFSGELSRYTTNGTPYNTTATNVTDESPVLKKYGIESASSRADYDANEALYSIRRTIEFPSVDYYMFRLGLSYDDLKKGNAKHDRQFAKIESGNRYLPQYENSFYFYFGARDGATALDEFNKQFFSECEDSTLIERETASFIMVDDYNFCTGKSFVTPYLKNMEGAIVYSIEGDGIYPDDDPGRLYGKWDDENSTDAFELPAGRYTFRATDEEGNELTTQFTVGGNLINAHFTSYDFNIPLENGCMPRTIDENELLYEGGYVSIEDIEINSDDENASDGIIIRFMGENGTIERDFSIQTGVSGITALCSSNTTYDVFMGVKCNGSDFHYIYATSLMLMDSNSVGLTIGPVMKIDYKSLNAFTEGWWMSSDNGSSDSPQKWNIRKSIVKANGTSGDVHSNWVEAINGLKSVFGTPQNANGIYGEKKLYTAEQDYDIPAGYTVDDDVTYYETYGCDGYNKSFQYNAMAFNGSTVSGMYAAKVTGGSGMTKSVELTSNGSKLRMNEGCLFKPLPEGDIIPAIFSGSTIKCLADNYMETDEYNKGIVYPTIVYPVIRKPFLVNANYFMLMDKTLVETTNEEGELWADAINEPSGVKCEARIENGLTYNHKYAGTSYMPVITNEETEEGCESTFSSSQSDLSGVNALNSSTGTSYYSGWADETPDDLSFAIQEGAPMYSNGASYSAVKGNGYVEYDDTYNYQNVADTAELGISYTFYDSVRYGYVNGAVYLGFDGYSDADIEYYVVPFGALKDLIEEESERNAYTWIKPEKQTFFALGKYTSRAGEHLSGKDVVVKIWNRGAGTKATVPFGQIEEDGSSAAVVYETKSLNLEVNFLIFKVKIPDFTIRDGEIKKYLERVEKNFDYKVSFDKRRDGKESSKTLLETNSKSWTTIFDRELTENRLAVPIGTIDIPVFKSNCERSSKYIVVGKKTITGGGMATSNVYMTYMYVNEDTGVFTEEDL